jgi:hypothetical protein
LADSALAEFALGVRQEDGVTLNDHLLVAWEQTGIMPEQLADLPERNPLTNYIWEYFWELSRRRGNNGFGIQRINYLDLDAWGRQTKRRLDLWELEALLAIDDAYVDASYQHKDKPK